MNPEEVASLQKKFELLLDNARNRHVPTIVLWGPGKLDSVGFKKRLKIKDNILLESPKAPVILPEDPEIQSLTQKFVRDSDLQEILQASVADLVFALDTAPGVGQGVLSILCK